MIRTIDFNTLSAGSLAEEAYLDQGLRITALGGSAEARSFDTSTASAEDADLASASLGNALIIAQDPEADPDNASDAPGQLFFDFAGAVRLKSLIFKTPKRMKARSTG